MYVYVGHDEGKDRFILADWYVLWSEDLVHWNWKRALRCEATYLPDDSVNSWACDCVQSPWDGKFYLHCSNAGEHDVTLRLTGEITLDWFTLKSTTDSQ